MAWLNRLSNLIRQRDLNPEIDEELQFHLDARIRDNIATGMTEGEARREALQRFGSRGAVREQTREANIVVTLETIAQDLAFAGRSLRKRPAFTIVALLTLALGIGANTAIFTIVHSVLIRPLPFPDSDQLYAISYAPKAARFWLYPPLGDAEFLEFRKADRLFESTASFGSTAFTLTGAGDPIRVPAAEVSTGFFRVLRIRPSAGRSFLPEDDQLGRERVVLIGDSLWRRRFGANPDVINRPITLDGLTYTVIGILPPGFSYPEPAEVWVPLPLRIQPNLGFWRPTIGRLRSDSTPEQARVELETTLGSPPRQEDPTRPSVAQIIPLKRAVAGDSRRALLVFAGAVGLVLLIACANVSNLLFVRAVSRRQEIATRLALGASRARVIRQLVTESTVMSLAGGAVGAFVAALGVPALLASIPAGGLPRDTEIHMDAWVFAFTFGLSLLIGLAIGLAPAFQATHEQLSNAIKGDASLETPKSHRLRHGLVVSEVALAMVLLIGAGLLVKSFLKLRAVDPGFEPANVMTMVVDLPMSRYRSAVDLQTFHDRLLAALRGLPDVVAAGVVNWRPFGILAISGDFQAEDRRPIPQEFNVTKASVSPGYFQAMGIRLAAGRDFTDRDAAGAPGVVAVSESVAREIWPNEDALGRRISLEDRPKPEDWLTVVAIVEDIRQGSLKEGVMPTVYRPYRQTSRVRFLNHVSFVVRTTGDPADVASAMRAALRSVDKDQAERSMATMEDAIAGTIAEPRFYTRLLAVFSILAVLLAAIGIYGVLASSVSERRREIGIRVALGADKGRIVRMVLRHTMLLAATGLALGTAGASALTHILTTLLFEVAPTDATAFAGAAGILAAIAVLAGVVPAWRASTVDPLVALRSL